MTAEQSTWASGLLRLEAPDFPATLHAAFEDELGYINTHLCIADTALRDFESAAHRDTKFVARRVRLNGHRRLNTDVVQLKNAMDLSYASHVALLLGRMAALCDRVRAHPLVDARLNEVAKGDYFRKALWVVLQSQQANTISCPVDDTTIAKHVSTSSLSTFDRFRVMRNTQFHSSAPSSAQHTEVTRFPDVLACSKALQELSRGLCRALAGPLPEVATVLTKRYGNLPPGRRRHAAHAALQQQYLLDATDIHGVLFDLAW